MPSIGGNLSPIPTPGWGVSPVAVKALSPGGDTTTAVGAVQMQSASTWPAIGTGGDLWLALAILATVAVALWRRRARQ